MLYTFIIGHSGEVLYYYNLFLSSVKYYVHRSPGTEVGKTRREDDQYFAVVGGGGSSPERNPEFFS